MLDEVNDFTNCVCVSVFTDDVIDDEIRSVTAAFLPPAVRDVRLAELDGVKAEGEKMSASQLRRRQRERKAAREGFAQGGGDREPPASSFVRRMRAAASDSATARTTSGEPSSGWMLFRRRVIDAPYR